MYAYLYSKALECAFSLLKSEEEVSKVILKYYLRT